MSLPPAPPGPPLPKRTGVAAGAAGGRRAVVAVALGVVDGIEAGAAIAAATPEETGVAAVAAKGAVAAGAAQKPAVSTNAVRGASRVEFEGRETVADQPTTRTDGAEKDRVGVDAGDCESRASVVSEPASPIRPPRPAQLAGFKRQSAGACGSVNPVDASFTCAVIGAGAPGAAISRAPAPTIAAPITPALKYWRTDILDARDVFLLCLDTSFDPSVRCPPATGRSC